MKYIYSWNNKVDKVTSGLRFCLLRQLDHYMANTFSMLTWIVVPSIDVCLSVCPSGIDIHIFLYNKVAKVTSGLRCCILRQLEQTANTFSMFTGVIIPFTDVCLSVWLPVCLVLIYICSLYNKIAKVTSVLRFCILPQYRTF